MAILVLSLASPALDIQLLQSRLPQTPFRNGHQPLALTISSRTPQDFSKTSLRSCLQGRQDLTRPGVATMSLTIFLALCILGMDFMIYALFKLLYADRRSLVARRVAAQREAAGLIFVPAPKSTPPSTEPPELSGSRMLRAPSRKPSARSAFHASLTSSRHQLQ